MEKCHRAIWFFVLIFLMFIVEGGLSRSRDRERDTELEAGSMVRVVSTEPDVGLKLMNREIMT